MSAIKKFEDPGLNLIGFKPMEKLKVHHHTRPAVFIYPEEDEVKGSAVRLSLSVCSTLAALCRAVIRPLFSISGSSCLFSALLTKCIERNVFALCRCVSRRNYPPRFVALVPQKEELDEGKVQMTPPGNSPPISSQVTKQSSTLS